MQDATTSRERVPLAVSYQEPDRIPIVFRSFGQVPPLEAHFRWRNALQRAAGPATLEVDDLAGICPPWPYHPDVRLGQWWQRRPDQEWPLTVKEIETRRGALHLAVKEAPDYIGADLPLDAETRTGRAGWSPSTRGPSVWTGWPIYCTVRTRLTRAVSASTRRRSSPSPIATGWRWRGRGDVRTDAHHRAGRPDPFPLRRQGGKGVPAGGVRDDPRVGLEAVGGAVRRGGGHCLLQWVLRVHRVALPSVDPRAVLPVPLEDGEHDRPGRGQVPPLHDYRYHAVAG